MKITIEPINCFFTDIDLQVNLKKFKSKPQNSFFCETVLFVHVEIIITRHNVSNPSTN